MNEKREDISGIFESTFVPYSHLKHLTQLSLSKPLSVSDYDLFFGETDDELKGREWNGKLLSFFQVQTNNNTQKY